MKFALISRPILQAPDYGQQFIVRCDASDRGMGAELCQRDKAGAEYPIVYISHKLTVREEAYNASKKQCACLVWDAQKLSCYLSGTRFRFQTDHCPLKWLQNMLPENGRLLRWSLSLQQYNFNVEYRKGKMNGNANGLSRPSA